MHKRNFLVSFSLFFVLIAFAQGSNKKQKDNACMQKEVYIQLYSVRADIKNDFKGTIAKIAEDRKSVV